MRKLTFGVANSLDGFIARPDHAFDWILWCDEAKALSASAWKGVDTLKDGGVQIVFNTTEGAQSIADSRAIRALTLSGRIPYYTTAAGARAAALAMRDRLEGDLRVR